MRIGVLGAGLWGVHHVRVLGNEPRVTQLVVAEPDAGRRDHVRMIVPRAEVVATAQELLDRVEAVVIATPAATHVELALAALERGKHVLVEKPVARSTVDHERLVEVARRIDRVAMAGHLMVFHPAIRRVRELLVSGTLGQPYYMHATRVNLGRLRQDENALWCFGPHDLSMMLFLLDERVVRVSACGQALLQPQIEDVVFATVWLASGVLAHLHLSWLHPHKERRFTLVCSDQMVEFDDVAPDKLRIYDRGFDRPQSFKEFAHFLTLRDGDVYVPRLSMEEPLQLELRHFLDCIETGERCMTSLDGALAITATLQAAQRSISLGGSPIDVEY